MAVKQIRGYINCANQVNQTISYQESRQYFQQKKNMTITRDFTYGDDTHDHNFICKLTWIIQIFAVATTVNALNNGKKNKRLGYANCRAHKDLHVTNT